MKAFSKPMQDYFKGRLYRLYICNSSLVIKIVWKITKKLVDPLTLQKFKVTGDDSAKEISELIDLENLEERFGGKLPNKTSNFFPPDLL